jgi:hypothetical protein
MSTRTLQSVPTVELARWLAQAERQYGTDSTTARTYRAELSRRDRPRTKAVRDAR